ILGIEPSPPPPDAGAIEPDVRGATTVRQQLEQHRRNATCAACHQKMDGYGFALESFDVAGEWRDKYRTMGGVGSDKERKRVNGRLIEYHYGLPVDCSGTMPDGKPFKDVRELSDVLASRPEQLASALASHLMLYATGAEISFADRPAIALILKHTEAGRYGV